MLRLKNLTKSPITVHARSGTKLLPAAGTLEIDAFAAGMEPFYRASRFVEVVDGGDAVEEGGKRPSATKPRTRVATHSEESDPPWKGARPTKASRKATG